MASLLVMISTTIIVIPNAYAMTSAAGRGGPAHVTGHGSQVNFNLELKLEDSKIELQLEVNTSHRSQVHDSCLRSQVHDTCHMSKVELEEHQ